MIDTFGNGQYLKGKTAIITGGNSGIGLETCKALAAAGARVILCSRSVKNGDEAVKNEIANPGLGGYTPESPDIVVKALDLQSLKSIKAFADEFNATEDRLDLLVLNAGIMAVPKRETTPAGFEKQIGVNHFGHAYLTQLLLDKLKSTATAEVKGRIVVLSSSAHSMGSVKPEDLHFTQGRHYKAWVAYGQSKLANMLFAKSLADKLKDNNIAAVSVHPGVIQTNLWQQSFFNKFISGFVTDKTIPQGAATTVWACVAPVVTTEGMRGAYLADCGAIAPSAEGRDDSGTLREALWQATEAQLLTGIQTENNAK